MTITQVRRLLYAWARILGDVNALSSGSPKRVARRGKNRVTGRLLGRAGFWRGLWR
jgi:hypothetical protein